MEVILGTEAKKMGSQVLKFFKWSCKQTSHDGVPPKVCLGPRRVYK